MNIAIIPARGGSKRIPRKNIRSFVGKPMMAWAIEAAHASDCFERVLVSTEDHEIAEVAELWGAEVAFWRPVELADDYAGPQAVMYHAIEWLRRNDGDVSRACCLYATAAFVTPGDIRQAAMLLDAVEAEYVVPVASFAFPILRALKVDSGSRIEMFWPQYQKSNSQDLEEAYHDAGQFYWGTADAWLKQEPIFGQQSVAFVLPRHRVQDIDTSEDWRRAELMFEALKRAGEL